MGAGKTTLGRAVADRLQRPFHDSDAEIEAREGRTGREFAAEHGVEALHHLEADVVLELLDRVEPCVIAAAASVVDTAELRNRLRTRAFCLWIDIAPLELHERIQGGAHRRTMELDDLKRLAKLRRPLFEQVCDLRVDGLLRIDAQLDLVIAALGRATAP